MARTIRNAKIDTRSARTKLAARREPYWTVMSRGRAIGYRRGAKGGSWIARLRADDGKQHYEALGAADDALDADGRTILTFAQAQEKARGFFNRIATELLRDAGEHVGPFTVADALAAYFRRREQEGSKGLAKDRAAANLRILPQLGEKEVDRLTDNEIRTWLSDLAQSATTARPKLDGRRKSSPVNLSDPDAVRARRSTANRTLTVLKAALNQAFAGNRVASDAAWKRVKPFREADAAVIRFLSEDEVRRLVNACEGTFRNLVRAALLTGCRYGELTRMRASDFGEESGTITVRESKAGKPRHIALTDEGRVLFAAMTAGRIGTDLIFSRDDGEAWGASHQQRPLDAACARAKIVPAATFHILRHTYGSTLAMKGVPMGVVAAQLGHADTRMTEKHYAHFAPSYVADTVRAALPNFGIVEPATVISLRPARAG